MHGSGVDLCFRYTAHVMADFIWGIDAGTFTRPEQPNKIQYMATRWTSYAFYMISWFMATIVAPGIRLLLKFRFYPKGTAGLVSNFTQHPTEPRLQSRKNSSRTHYLSHLLQLREQKQATHDDLVGHALTVLLDGYDTTGTASFMHCITWRKVLQLNKSCARKSFLAWMKKRASILTNFAAYPI
ncbi:probable cytochrome P450 309a2 [Drosophila bipectinata]|uniref:probable cytochrome P450 309a2 n=1 Tax=Drosophila bipectinata TaxID=42026 RepID=UPI0038B376A0